MKKYRVEVDEWGEEDYIEVLPWWRALGFRVERLVRDLRLRFCLPALLGRTFTSRQDGSWHDPATWGRKHGCPGENPRRWDRARIIGHAVTMTGGCAYLANLRFGKNSALTLPPGVTTELTVTR